MKHLSNEDAVDFVNQVMPRGKLAETQKHLESGCRRCAETLATWQNVRNTSWAGSDYQPPSSTVRIVKAAFAAAGLGASTDGLKLLFDSILQPAASGVRSMPSDTRQLLYSVGPYVLDLYISAKPGGKLISVTGQLMNARFPERILNSVPVLVANGTGTVVLATTNAFGEFQGEVDYSGDLELRLPNQGNQEIIVRLGCLLVGLAGPGAESGKHVLETPRS